MASWIAKRKNLLLWLGLTAGLGSWLSYVLLRAEDKTALLPGITTDGHYQIEMQCNACHTNEKRENVFTSSGVTNESCLSCHGEELEAFSDSHPIRKFRNPENAMMLEHIDALNCITCHKEHNRKITGPMAVTLPSDYCAHCHEVTLENLESHRDLSFQTCATAGCHNYHDNTALAPSFLLRHYGQPDHLPGARVPATTPLQRWLDAGNEPRQPLSPAQADAPADHTGNQSLVRDWHDTAHAQAGINCRDCHGDRRNGDWISKPDHTSCAHCHGTEVGDFLKGKHGMRLAHEGLSPMRPGLARRPMHEAAAHATLSCNSCHEPHRDDVRFAAHEACVKCHNDPHTQNYRNSAHYAAWTAELAGEAAPGTGVSCATCHLPREQREDSVLANHNQNANLTPNEKMLRTTCLTCHGQHFAMSALADRDLIERNFTGPPSTRHPGMDWVADSAVKRGDPEVLKIRKYLESLPNSSNSNSSNSNQN